MTDFLARQERFRAVGSTNDVVRDWLMGGTPEVCLAIADEQTAGRGRDGRTWVAPPGAALLLSLGFRPDWLAPERVWRLAATVSLAMADAAEEVAGLPDHAIRCKWPNDLVVETVGTAIPLAPQVPTEVRKLAGVLGETGGLGSHDPWAVVGIGMNTEWLAADFPAELATTMTSLREASSGRPIDHAALLDAFLGRLEVRIAALRGGRFDVGDWTARQLTNGRDVDLVAPDGSVETVRALGVDAASGALVVAGRSGDDGDERHVLVGEIRHVRLASPIPAAAIGVTR
jgi:BirA family biotin operon repressor/biotin-[acetyl-CoA-carboxylase] ligase